MSSTLTSLRAAVKWFPASAFCIVFILISSAAISYSQDSGPTEDPVAIFNQAQEAHEKGDLAGAILLYEKALKIMPEFPEAEYQRGIAFLALRKNGDAEKAFRRAVELRPDWTLAMTSLGSLLAQKPETSEAETLLTKAVGIDPQNQAALVALADLKTRMHAPPAVLQQLLTSVSTLTSKANPAASLWSARAGLEIALGKKNEAKLSVAKALAIDPKYRWALHQSADLAVRDGDTDTAKQVVATLESLSENPDSLNLLKANIAAAEGQFGEAVKFLDTIKTSGPAADDLRKIIAASQSTTAGDLEKSLAANSKDPVVLGKLCILMRRDDPAKALDYCRRAAETEPGNISHAIGFGAALVQAKQFEQAAAVLKKIVEIVPENWTAHANLATALFQLKRYPEAKSEFEWLTARQPKSAAAYYFLAIAHDQLSEYMDAMANYQKYLSLADPVLNKLDIDKINLRLPALQRDIREGKGKKN